MIERQNLLAVHPFARLNRLLAGIAPGDPRLGLADHAPGAPIFLQVGEPQNQPPTFVAGALHEAAAGWSRYPPPLGTPAYLEACIAWLTRRYNLPPGMIDPETMILPLPGTREGLFLAALACTPGPGGGSGNGRAPLVLMPNPAYHVYIGAVAAALAEPMAVPATRESGFLPDYGALPTEVLARAGLCYFNSPSNPQGAVADPARMTALIELARAHDFTVAFDECYSEIYTDAPPPGSLQAAAALGGSLDNMLVFHSLSKRSSAPGLRCGFVVGDPRRIAALDAMLRFGGAGVPLPVLAAGTRCWQDEAHVEENRARYQTNFAVAERVLGNRFGFRKPAGGFFLWLEVGDGKAAARTLWREAGIRVLPGAYMTLPEADGVNPGADYIRVALVYDPALTEAALNRIVEVL